MLAAGVRVVRAVALRVRLLLDPPIDICHPLRGRRPGACGAAYPAARRSPPSAGRCRPSSSPAPRSRPPGVRGVEDCHHREDTTGTRAGRACRSAGLNRALARAGAQRSAATAGGCGPPQAKNCSTPPRAGSCRIVRCRSRRFACGRAALRGRALIVQRCAGSELCSDGDVRPAGSGGCSPVEAATVCDGRWSGLIDGNGVGGAHVILQSTLADHAPRDLRGCSGEVSGMVAVVWVCQEVCVSGVI